MLNKILYATFLILLYKFSFAQFSIGVGFEIRNTNENYYYTLYGIKSSSELGSALDFIDVETNVKNYKVQQFLPNLTFSYKFKKRKVSFALSKYTSLFFQNVNRNLETEYVITENKNMYDSAFPFLTFYNADLAIVNFRNLVPLFSFNYYEKINEKLSFSSGLGMSYSNPLANAVNIIEKRYYFLSDNNNPNSNPLIGYYPSNSPFDPKPDRQVESIVYHNRENRFNKFNFFPSFGFEYQLNKFLNLSLSYQFNLTDPYHKDVDGKFTLSYTSLGLNFNVYTLKKKSNKPLDTSQQ
jgi:hypothetical protein